MMMHKSKKTLTLLAMSIAWCVHAGTMGAVAPAYKPLITLSAGADFVQGASAQYLALYPPYENYYTVTNATKTVFDGGVFIGIEKAFYSIGAAQLGFSAYFDSNNTTTGRVWQFALPIFDNLQYNYSIQSSRYTASGKFLTNLAAYPAIYPYFSWDLGVAVNRATGYRETSLVPGVLPMVPFANHTRTSFAFGVGVGLDYVITQQLRLGVGYQFADLGAASLGTTPDALTQVSLSRSHLYTNQVRAQLGYLFAC